MNHGSSVKEPPPPTLLLSSHGVEGREEVKKLREELKKKAQEMKDDNEIMEVVLNKLSGAELQELLCSELQAREEYIAAHGERLKSIVKKFLATSCGKRLEIKDPMAEYVEWWKKNTPDQQLEGQPLLELEDRMKDSDDIRDILSTHAVNVNEGTQFSHSPFVAAVKSGKLAHVELLLAHPDIDVNAADPAGSTALMYSAWGYYTYPVMCRLLQDPRIDVHLKDAKGKTALDTAIWRNRRDDEQSRAIIATLAAHA